MERQQRPAAATTPDTFFLPDFCARGALGVLVLVAELLAVVLALAAGGISGEFWGNLGLASLAVQWVTLTTAALLCALRDLLARLPRRTAAALAWGLIVLDTLVLSAIAQYLYGWIFDPQMAVTGVDLGRVVGHVLIAAIIGGLVLRYFYVQEQLRLQQEAELKARIQALQSRIRPHFLFNSMNIIASLIAVDPDAAESVVLDLADLFRASLRDAGNEVPLAHELDLCRRYVRIEQLRMGDRLQVDWQLATNVDKLRIPLLTLQPLLENAVYHGIQPLADGGTVTVSVDYRDGEVWLAVRNPVTDAPAGTSHRGNNMAMENIRHRLQALYGPRAGLDGGRDGNSYSTVLHYPFNIGASAQPETQ